MYIVMIFLETGFEYISHLYSAIGAYNDFTFEQSDDWSLK